MLKSLNREMALILRWKASQVCFVRLQLSTIKNDRLPLRSLLSLLVVQSIVLSSFGLKSSPASSSIAMAPSSEKWLQRLESETGTFVRKGRGKHQARRIRIAILDTGVDPRNVAFAGPVSKGLVKVEDFVTPGGDALDLHGHGTHCVGLLCRIAPEAEIYVAKVANDRNRLPDVNAVTKVWLMDKQTDRAVAYWTLGNLSGCFVRQRPRRCPKLGCRHHHTVSRILPVGQWA